MKDITDIEVSLNGIPPNFAHWEQAPASFLQAWKQAATLAGVHYFGDGTEENLTQTSNIEDLAPDFEKIQSHIGALSSGEGVFLAILSSFYNAKAGRQLMESVRAGGMGDMANSLDLKRRKLIADLFVNYTVW